MYIPFNIFAIVLQDFYMVEGKEKLKIWWNDALLSVDIAHDEILRPFVVRPYDHEEKTYIRNIKCQ
jgi:hypothetical protein